MPDRSQHAPCRYFLQCVEEVASENMLDGGCDTAGQRVALIALANDADYDLACDLIDSLSEGAASSDGIALSIVSARAAAAIPSAERVVLSDNMRANIELAIAIFDKADELDANVDARDVISIEKLAHRGIVEPSCLSGKMRHSQGCVKGSAGKIERKREKKVTQRVGIDSFAKDMLGMAQDVCS